MDECDFFSGDGGHVSPYAAVVTQRDRDCLFGIRLRDPDDVLREFSGGLSSNGARLSNLKRSIHNTNPVSKICFKKAVERNYRLLTAFNDFLIMHFL